MNASQVTGQELTRKDSLPGKPPAGVAEVCSITHVTECPGVEGAVGALGSCPHFPGTVLR